MDRYAIFVDAGYLFAAGGELVHGQAQRGRLRVEAATLLDRLRAVAAASNPGDFLRMYWYDAAINAVPQREHWPIAAVPGIKLRLGRLTRNGQKGVDSLVVRDMMRLASEHAISTAFLLSGDEDLRQGMVEAQDYGVKVVLLGITSTWGDNQADTLVWEADGVRTLGFEELRDCIELTDGVEHPGADDWTLDPEATARGLAADWRATATAAQRAALAEAGRIPPDADAQLIFRLLEAAGLSRDDQVPGRVLMHARRCFREAALEPIEEEERGRVPAEAEETEPAPVPPVPETRPVVVMAEPPADLFSPFAIGQRLARSLLRDSPGEEAYLRTEYPRLPRDVDSQLLRRLVGDLGLPTGAMVEDEDRKAARAGFWSALGLAAPESPSRRAPFPAITANDPEQFGEEFGRAWLARCTAEDSATARRLMENRMGLPAEADRELLRLAAAHFGDPVPSDCRNRLREGFENAVRSA